MSWLTEPVEPKMEWCNICKDNHIDGWEIGKIVRKKDSTISKFLPEILT